MTPNKGHPLPTNSTLAPSIHSRAVCDLCAVYIVVLVPAKSVFVCTRHEQKKKGIDTGTDNLM